MKYFEILGITKTWYGSASKVYPEQIQVDRHGKETKVTKLNDGAVLLHSEVPQNETYYMVDGKYYTQVYAIAPLRFKSAKLGVSEMVYSLVFNPDRKSVV